MDAMPDEKKRYTYADYVTWDDGERWELIDGVPYKMTFGSSENGASAMAAPSDDLIVSIIASAAIGLTLCVANSSYSTVSEAIISTEFSPTPATIT